ncbi:hypothetical protein BKA93DRAFT_817214 [Sparassis latifolia]
MSLKAELETWAAALKAYDEEAFERSIEIFSTIADSSKILTNIGLIYATLGEHELAVEQFTAAVQLDQYLAIAYFQCGVSNFLLNRFDAAIRDFDDALIYLRGNQDINYDQIGLKFQLWSAEILFNRGLSRIYKGFVVEGLADMEEARREKITREHNVIDEAIAERGQGYTVFSIPVGVLYRPSESKLKNAKAKDYLGKAKLVATSDESDAYTEFTGVARLRQGISPTGAAIDGAMLSRATTVANPTASRMRDDGGARAVPLQRSKTTINVATNYADRTRAATSRPSSPAKVSPVRRTLTPPPAPSGALARSMTSGARAVPPSLSGLGPGVTRGLSIRKPGTPPYASPAPPSATVVSPAPVAPASTLPASGAFIPDRNKRLPPRTTLVTDFYDEYLSTYGQDTQPMSAPAMPTAAMQRSRSTYQSASSGAGAGSDGSMRRRPTRRGTTRSRPDTRHDYEEDEEGYASGDYDDLAGDVIKIRVKLHYQEDVRGMTFMSDMPWKEFLARVTGKFGRELDGLGMQFRDEDGEKVSLRDEMDYELAIETAREAARGKEKSEGRLEIWCVAE